MVAATVAATLCFPNAATAQSGPPADSAARRIEPVEVRSARTVTVVGGSSVAIVRPDSARIGVAPTLADLLRTIPQVLVRTNSRGEVELSVRGSESRQVSLMVNGLPLSPSWDGRADPSLIPLSGVTELTVVRSTASLLGGPNAIGGVVELQIGAPAPGGERALSLGGDETGARLLSASAGGSGRRDGSSLVYWRLGAGHRDRAGLARAAGVPDADPRATLRTNTDLRQSDGFAALGIQGPRGAQLSVLMTAYDTERGVAPELHLISPRRWRYPLQSRSAVQLRAVSPSLASSAGITSLDASAGVLDARIRIRSFTDDTYTTENGREAGDERVASGRIAMSHILPGGTTVRAAATGNLVRYDETLNANPSSRYRQRLLSSGVESQWILGNRSLVSAGVVLDAARTLESGGKTATPARSVLGWRLGATSLVRPELRAHASVSDRGRFPALRELYSGSLDRFEPNPGLRPERLVATETGLTWGAAEASTGLGVQVVAFHHRLRDAVVRVPFDTTTRFIRVNRDETRSTGAELTLGWRDLGARDLRLDLVAQRVRVLGATGGGAGQKPEHMPGIRATLDGALPVRGGVVLGARLAHIGAQYCVNVETNQDVGLSALTVASATAHRSWTLAGAAGFRALRLVFGADNLLGAAVYEQCGLPRAGRTIRFGIELR